MTETPHIYVALPVMDEPEWLPVILHAIGRQTFRNFTIVTCVNQPDSWWSDPAKAAVCQHNSGSLSMLAAESGFKVEVIDRSSWGAGWTGKMHGVGWARKTLMDHISQKANPTDIILSLDADTRFAEDYFGSLPETLSVHPKATAISTPYYHDLPEDQDAARAILRYEIYMRYYFLNLWRIRSPYAFTALGSAMAVPVWAYRKVGGMTPKLSGEDFYFLQKLKKAGHLINWNRVSVFPAARFSSRVFFGTGPAMIRGAAGDWTSYPIYSFRLFDEIAETYRLFPEMYRQTVATSVIRFLQDTTGREDPLSTLRKNANEASQFVRACHEKFDGLRILQYLKRRHQEEKGTDEDRLREWLKDKGYEIRDMGNKFSFAENSIEELDQVRNFLSQEENRVRKENPLC
ncbi:MAG: hypothetical protein IH596_00645 [Bacteroidales bacterium]|nr:hypothetical protein [Bacteroidales bacterium]